MSTILSISRWIFLLTLSVVMFASVAQANDVPSVGLTCCHQAKKIKVQQPVKQCYEQEPRDDCNVSAFVVITKSNKQRCISPETQWIKNMIEKGELSCPPEYSKKRKFKVLDDDVDEDDVDEDDVDEDDVDEDDVDEDDVDEDDMAEDNVDEDDVE